MHPLYGLPHLDLTPAESESIRTSFKFREQASQPISLSRDGIRDQKQNCRKAIQILALRLVLRTLREDRGPYPLDGDYLCLSLTSFRRFPNRKRIPGTPRPAVFDLERLEKFRGFLFSPRDKGTDPPGSPAL